jgi:hypothetical protein
MDTFDQQYLHVLQHYTLQHEARRLLAPAALVQLLRCVFAFKLIPIAHDAGSS